MDELTPKAIVKELDKYIIGQDSAKRSVAIALRNRYRRQRMQAELKDEVVPKNRLRIGPTGVGKTEIARRLAKLSTPVCQSGGDQVHGGRLCRPRRRVHGKGLG